MTDKLTPARRSENMRRIKSKDMRPELLIRKLVYGLGYRYRLHRKDLPGKPDLVFGPLKKVIFVHGCFWHGHELASCLDGRNPKSNTEYWNNKLAGNKSRDKRNTAALKGAGWKALTIWECEIENTEKTTRKILKFLKDKKSRAG